MALATKKLGKHQRPCAPVEWSYDWSFDDTIPQRAELTALFQKFTEVNDDRNGVFVVTPQTKPEVRRAAWSNGAKLVELDQLEAQLPTAQHYTLEYIDALKPSGEAWSELLMLLATWDKKSVAAAIARAGKVLERWPDELRVAPKVIDKQLVKLCEVPKLERLELTAENEGAETIDLAKLLATPKYKHVHALALHGYTLSKKDLDALASCSQPLRMLKLSYAGMKPEAGKQLAKIAAKKKLERLILKYNDLGGEGIEAMFASGDWSSLVMLDISGNDAGDRGVTALEKLRSLRWLDLSWASDNVRLTAAVAKSLASLKSLEWLSVQAHPIGAEAVATLLTSLPALKYFDAGMTQGSIEEIVVAAAGKKSSVETLALDSLELPPKGVKADWAKAQLFANVRSLDVRFLRSYAGLLSCPHLGALEQLKLGAPATNAAKCFDALVAATPPAKLQHLGLSGFALNPAQAQRLADSAIGNQVWGVELSPSNTKPAVWKVLYEGGVPLADYPFHFSRCVFKEDELR